MTARSRAIDVRPTSPTGSPSTSPTAQRARCAFDLIAGGHSNLTFRVTDATGSRWVLRRPPLGHVLATAHDMGREHRIISALGPTDVPVPRHGLCTDDAVNGAPFYVMGFVDGPVVRDADDRHALARDAAAPRAGESIVDVLAAIHAVDVDAVGLGDLGRKEGYIERQLKRWYGAVGEVEDPRAPRRRRGATTAARADPRAGPAAIVHGDYRLDNCMLGDDGRRRRRARLGDLHARRSARRRRPADGVLDGARTTHPAAAHRAPPTVDGLPHPGGAARPLRRAPPARDLAEIDYYVAFGYWKLACIVRASTPRYVGGAMGPRRAARRSSMFFADHVALAEPRRQPPVRARMSHLYEFHQDPALEPPVLVVGLEGWIDAGGGAASAAETILASAEQIPVATFNSDTLLDHRARRPIMHLVDGVNTGLTWPTIRLDETGTARGGTCSSSSGRSPTTTGRRSPRP